MCAVPNIAVFCSSLTSWFPGMLLTYFLNDLEMAPVAHIIIIIIIIIIIFLLLKSPILLRQGADRSTSHDAPIIDVIGSEYI
jgi:hypothetical protein